MVCKLLKTIKNTKIWKIVSSTVLHADFKNYSQNNWKLGKLLKILQIWKIIFTWNFKENLKIIIRKTITIKKAAKNVKNAKNYFYSELY